MTITINIRDLHKNLKQIPEMVDEKGEILVMKNSKPAFKISSLRHKRTQKYSFEDLKGLQFSGNDTDLSKNIDSYLYF